MEESKITKIAATADAYRLLSACFCQPEESFLEENLFGQLQISLGESVPQLRDAAVRLEATFRKENLEVLLRDYSRLFLGPFEILAKPYGSVYLEGESILMGESTLAARDCYRQAGFRPARDFKEVPDHVAVELEFLYHLCFREAHALAARDAAAVAEHKSLRHAFLSNHLGRWVSEFCARICAGGSCEFYYGLGVMLDSFMLQEQQN